tara:strand:- start:285 stop:689 length:405 start_codon:yes stop_codon:yes gene_type:complete
MKKLNVFVLFLILSIVSFSQESIKPCGQIPQINPTVKAKCLNDINEVLSESLPESFSKDKKYESTFKLIVDCNGRIDMVIYKRGNLSESQQKYFLTQLNELKDWTSAQHNGTDVSTAVYFTIDLAERQITFKRY